MRKFSNISILAGIFLLIAGIGAPFSLSATAEALAESDVPFYTYTTMSYGLWFMLAAFGVSFLLAGIISKIFRTSLEKSCTVKSSVCCFGSAASVSIMLYCIFMWYMITATDTAYYFTTAYPLSIVGTLGGLALAVTFSIIYIKERRNIKAYKGILFEIPLWIFSFLAFILLWEFIYGLLIL